MSGIYGRINLDGKPLDANLLQLMAEAMASYGRDRRGVQLDGSIGFGHLLALNTPESFGEEQPLEDEGLLISADARLDNRLELFDRLEIPPAGRTAVTDDRLILSAYRKWGPTSEFVAQLLGAFAFAVWDARRRSLFLARDHAGFRPLFYYHNPRFFAFASDVRALIADPDVPHTLDEDYFLAQDLNDHAYVLSHSPYKEIHKLESGMCLTLQDGRLSRQAYWLPSLGAELRLKSLDEYAERLLELLREAVRARLRTAYPLGVHLSGGLDSSVVTVLSKQEIEKQARKLGGVFSWSPTLEDLPAGIEDDERQYLDALAAQEGFQISYRKLTVQGAVDSYERDLLHEPLRQVAEESFICKDASERGIRTLLSGWGGDELVSYRGWGYLAELFARLRWGKLYQAARCTARVQDQGLLRTLLDNVVKPLVPTPVYQILGRGAPYYLRKSLASKGAGWNELYPQEREMLQRVYLDKAAPVGVHAHQLRIWRSGLLRFRLESWGHLGRRWGVDYRYPLLDRRIVDFALSLPPDVHVQDGKTRYLMRYAARDLLPKNVIWRTQKLEMARRSLIFQVTQEGIQEYLQRHFGRTPRGNLHLIYQLRLIRIMNRLLTLDGELLDSAGSGPSRLTKKAKEKG